MGLTHKERMRRCIEECKTCGSLNTASGAERLVEMLAEQVDETYGQLSEDIKKIAVERKSINLYDKDDPDHELDVVINYYNGGRVGQINSDVTGYIEIKNGRTYSCLVYPGTYGWTGTGYVALYDRNRQYIGNASGQYNADNIITVTIDNANAVYMRTNVLHYGRNEFMIVEGEDYPDEYIPYKSAVMALRETIYIPSALHGKTVVFTGDSICHGATDETGVRGWAQRIGEKNCMIWTNAGISGATITANVTGSAGCIGDTDFGENPDYIIFEGGTNDADLIGGKDDDGNMPAKYGQYGYYKYDGFDKNTFCGAVEDLFRRVVTDYPTAKIGFIIVHKMGGYEANDGYYFDAEHSNRRYYFETIIALCKKWGIPYIDLWEGCHLNAQISRHSALFYANKDYQHLSAAGYDLITPKIEAWMLTL